MTTTRSSLVPTLALAFIALLGSTAMACTPVGTSSARRHHDSAAPQPAVASTLTTEYQADRAALLQAALHGSDATTTELALHQQNSTLVTAVVSIPASVQL